MGTMDHNDLEVVAAFDTDDFTALESFLQEPLLKGSQWLKHSSAPRLLGTCF